MKMQMVGLSHHSSNVEVRERLAFSPDQARTALEQLRAEFPESEAVLISTCNRMELYVASGNDSICPTHEEVIHFLANFHGIDPIDILDNLLERSGEDAIRHLFTVAASLDSMVIGEAQILSQVKQAYEMATAGDCTGPATHAAFQASIRVAKRVSTETAIQQNRVSIPSVAVADFAKNIFESFTDKHVLVIGAGEMGEETLRYIISEGARKITVVNRNQQRALDLVDKLHFETQAEAKADSWDNLFSLLATADLVISTTGATEPIVTAEDYAKIDHDRFQKPLFVLDLAIPRDFDPKIAEQHNVYLYSIDDLTKACEANRKKREKEWPRAKKIIEDETDRFMSEWRHRATGPTIKRLKQQSDQIKESEVERLFKKLDGLSETEQNEIRRSFDRVINKLLHPPLESLRDEAQQGTPHGLVDALKRLFQLKD